MKVHLLLLLLFSALVFTSSEKQEIVNEQFNDLTAEETEKVNSEKFEFQAEVNRMMKLIIHSLYKSKEIFLRELISNASDALDKIRFLSLTKPEVLASNKDLKISIRADTEKKQLIITDSGVGMTKKDLIRNLGTIAKSGTAEFLAALESKASDSNLIGQFGVGFYSAFLVADKVTVISKNNNDSQHVWESHAESDFSVFPDPRGDTLGRGTQIILHLKSDAEEYLEEARLEKLIRKYSEFINFPIYLYSKKTEEVEVPLTEDEIKEQEKEKEEKEEKEKSEDDVQVEEVDEKEEKKKTKTEERVYFDWELINAQKPIWTRDPKNVTEKEYEDFYKAFSRDTNSPMTYIHFKAEGDVDFKSILYIPSKAPPNLLQSSDAHIKAIKLFVRKVFITDELLDFIPRYLNFLRGLVDSEDLPLNVSRETLQQHRLLKMIRRKVIKKALDMISRLSKDEEAYKDFLKEYNVNLKVGVIEDLKNRKKLLKLLRFWSSHDDEKQTSIQDYFTRMKKGQEQIYFLTGPSLEEIKKSPFVERIIARGYEVLYLDEPIDEYLVQALHDYEKKSFQNVAKDGLKFGDEDKMKEKLEALTEEYKPLTEYFKTILSASVEKVVVSNRLTTSPCAIIASQWGWSGNQERLMSSQALPNGEDGMRQFQAMQKKTLEINPKHPVIMKLLEKVTNDEHSNDESIETTIKVLYESTAIRSGYQLKDSSSFSSMIESILRKNLGVDLEAKAEVEDLEMAVEQDAPVQEELKKQVEEEAEKEEKEEEAAEKDEDFDHDEL